MGLTSRSSMLRRRSMGARILLNIDRERSSELIEASRATITADVNLECESNDSDRAEISIVSIDGTDCLIICKMHIDN